MNECPSSEALGQLLAGSLAEPQAGTVREHLAGCPACQARMDGLSDVPQLRQWGLVGPPPSAPDQPPPPGLLERLRETVLLEPQAPRLDESPGPAALPFLGPPQREGELGCLGPYRVLSELGRGGMGVVFKAYDPGLERTVAIKVLWPGVADKTARARFVREAQAAAAIDHENVVATYAVANPPDGPPYLVMQYVAGRTLRERVQTEGPLEPAEAARVCVQAAEGLAAAHRAGLVHRDVKPGNILLDDAGRARVLDFGLVHVQDRPGVTREAVIRGTPEYLSPEQVREPDRVDERTDVYGLGVTLYEALTGEVPFRGVLDRVLQQVLSEEPVPPRRLNGRVPRDLETVCLKAMAKEPGRRYPTARELADDLRRWLKGEPVRARPVGPRERAWRWARRNPSLAATGTLAVAALAAALVVSVCFAVREGVHASHLRDALDVSVKNQREAEHRLAESYLARGIALCEQQEVGRGLLWMVRSLETAPADAADLRRVIRLNLAGWEGRLHALRATLEHGDGVRVVAFSPDGRLLLTAVTDGAARLWDADTGRPDPAGPLRHPDKVLAATFAGDGRIVWTACADGVVRRWDAATGRGVGEFRAGPGLVAAAFSAEGPRVAVAGKDGAVRVWDATTGQAVGPNLPHPAVVPAVAFGPGGREVFTGCADRKARLWRVAGGEVVTGPLEHSSAVRSVAVSPDGRVLLAGTTHDTARLWDAHSGRPLPGGLLQHRGPVNAVAFSPDGRVALTGTLDRTARLWDVSTGRPLGAPLIHSAGVNAVAFSRDGRKVLTGGHDRVARLWELHASPVGATTLRHGRGVQAVTFSPDGATLLTGSIDGTACLWDARTGALRFTLRHPHWVNAVAFSPDGRIVLTACGDRTGTAGGAQLWDVATGRPVGGPLPGGQGFNPQSVAFSPDGRTAVTAGRDGRAWLWDTATGRPRHREPLAHDNPVHAVAFSPDGRTLLTGSGTLHGGRQGEAGLWDVTTGRPVAAPLGQARSVVAVAWAPDGKWFVTGCADGIARLWDARTREPIGEPLRHQMNVRAVAVSPDGKQVLTGSFDHSARLWDAAPRGLGNASVPLRPSPRLLSPPLEHRGWVRAVAFSPDGRYLLTASFDHTGRLWDAATRKPLGPPLGHDDWVVAIAWAPDGRTVATASQDGTARLWPVPAPLPDEPERLALWARVLTGMHLDEDGVVHVLDPAAWQAARERLKEQGGPPATASAGVGGRPAHVVEYEGVARGPGALLGRGGRLLERGTPRR